MRFAALSVFRPQSREFSSEGQHSDMSHRKWIKDSVGRAQYILTATSVYQVVGLHCTLQREWVEAKFRSADLEVGDCPKAGIGIMVGT